MGQIHLVSVQMGRQSEVVSALEQVGFNITRTPPEQRRSDIGVGTTAGRLS
jgi:hypothetical protein